MSCPQLFGPFADKERERPETTTSNNSLRSLYRLKYRGSIRTIPNEASAAWLETQHKALPKGGQEREA